MKILRLIPSVFGLVLLGCSGCGRENNGPQNVTVSLNNSEKKRSQGMMPTWWQAFASFLDNPTEIQIADRLRGELQIAAEQSDAVQARFALALLERESGRWEKAKALFQTIGLENNGLYSAGALWNLGRISVQEGNWDQAEVQFEKSRSIAPNAWQPVYALSQLRRRQGRVSESLEILKQAQDLGAGQTDPRGAMGDEPMPFMPDELYWR